MHAVLRHAMRANKKLSTTLSIEALVVKTRGFTYPAAGGGDEPQTSETQ
jgi:hypothetical protein